MGKHNKYTLDKNKAFVNPYNFVQLSDGKNSRVVDKNYSSDLLSGVLNCRLTVKSPLAILDTDNRSEDKKGHPAYSFYRIDNKCAIPGSSIRGCVRSMYETVTNSCLSTLAENSFLSNRVQPKDVYKPGILMKKDGGWDLFKAERLCVKDKASNPDGFRGISVGGEFLKLGDPVVCREMDGFAEDINKYDGEDAKYFLYVGEKFSKKKYESVFKKGKQIDVDEDELKAAINGLRYGVFNNYQNPSINRNLNKDHTGYKAFEEAEEKGVIPVWYSRSGKILSLSMAAIGRKVYHHTVSDLVGDYYKPCEPTKGERLNVCPACRLFGSEKKDGLGSRIRFSDALIVGEEKLKENVTLKELATPRPGYLQFYALKGIDYDESGAMIRGRKFYWHNPQACKSEEPYCAKEETKRNATVELMEAGEFSFNVYFDGITEEELKSLEWILCLSDNSKDSRICYKIGHGKPLGLGSVKICVEKESIRSFSPEGGYLMSASDNISFDNDSPQIVDDDAWSQLEKILNFDFLEGADIKYPYVCPESGDCQGRANDSANHHWFSENKSKANGNVPKLLPSLESGNEKRDFELHPYKFNK